MIVPGSCFRPFWTASVPLADCDPYWDSVVLAMHFDGINGATTFTDEKGHTLTANGNAQITSIGKFDQAGLFDGTGDYVTVPYGPELAFGNKNFCIEMWLYPTGTNVAPVRGRIWGCGGVKFHELDISISNGYLSIVATSNGTAWNIVGYTSIVPIPLNTWTHIAVVRNGGNITLYTNGVGITLTSSAGTTSLSHEATADIVRAIGGEPTSLFVESFRGKIDDLCVYIGVPKYTANFTPPTAPFPDIACPVVLPDHVLSCLGETAIEINTSVLAIVLNPGVTRSGSASNYRYTVTGATLYISLTWDVPITATTWSASFDVYSPLTHEHATRVLASNNFAGVVIPVTEEAEKSTKTLCASITINGDNPRQVTLLMYNSDFNLGIGAYIENIHIWYNEL